MKFEDIPKGGPWPEYVALVREVGFGFHPDTPSDGYDPPLPDPARYDRVVEAARDAVTPDLYAVGLAVWDEMEREKPPRGLGVSPSEHEVVLRAPLDELRMLAHLVDWYYAANPSVDNDEVPPPAAGLLAAQERIGAQLRSQGVTPTERRDDEPQQTIGIGFTEA